MPSASSPSAARGNTSLAVWWAVDGIPAKSWPGCDVATAEKLIDTCGCHRRDDELADAKNASGL